MKSFVVLILLAISLQSVIAKDNPKCRFCAYKLTDDGKGNQEFCDNFGFKKRTDFAACCDPRCLVMDEDDDDWPIECQTEEEERCFKVELVDDDDNVLAANRGGTEKNSLLESWTDLQVGENQHVLTETCKKDFCNGANSVSAALVIPALIFTCVMFLRK